ncbi:MAG: hypothetical protein ACYS72_00510 [Planctomycetota bacterium]|jgi:hypothetical protein
MKEKIDLKDPNVYYILVPVLAAMWAVMAGLVLYPKSVKAWDESEAEYTKAQTMMDQLVTLQPERLAYKVDENAKSQDFDFTKTINEFAGALSIPPSNYNLTVRSEANRGGRKTRSASISIKAIDIEKLAQFLSALLLRWPDLRCDTLSFSKIKDAKNNWQADISLTYFY